MEPNAAVDPIEDIRAAGKSPPEGLHGQPPRRRAGPGLFPRMLGAGALAGALAAASLATGANPDPLAPWLLLAAAQAYLALALAVLLLELDGSGAVLLHAALRVAFLGALAGLAADLAAVGLVRGSPGGGLYTAGVAAGFDSLLLLLVLMVAALEPRQQHAASGLVLGAWAGFGCWAAAALGLSTGSALAPALVRALLAPGAAPAWGALLGAALWRAKGEGPLRPWHLLHPILLKRLAAVTALHLLWDLPMLVTRYPIQEALLAGIGIALLVVELRSTRPRP